MKQIPKGTETHGNSVLKKKENILLWWNIEGKNNIPQQRKRREKGTQT